MDKWEFLDLLATQYNRFLFDNFQTTEQIYSATTGTADVTPRLLDLTLSTGQLSESTALVYYAMNWFNPVYSQLFLRARVGSMKNVFVFFGFKEKLTVPAFDMTESHAGVMINNNKMYWSTGRTTPEVSEQQRTQITGIDMTKDFIYKLIFDSVYTQPLPQIIPYFDTFRIITPDRIWTLNAKNSTWPPYDTVHYLMFFIKNTTGEDKYLKIKQVVYGEEYAD